MLYSEFLEGTSAVDNKATWDEYQRVETIYMESDHMTKEDAYRMAKVVTVKEYETEMKKQRKLEDAWVRENIFAAASFIRFMSEKEGRWTNLRHRSQRGNLYELKKEFTSPNGAVDYYALYINGKKWEGVERGYRILPSSEISSYNSRWYGMSIEQLKEIVGYIA